MYSRPFEDLDDVVHDAREELPTYRDILEISDTVKKSEPKRSLPKRKRTILGVYQFLRRKETWGRLSVVTRNLGTSFSGYKKPGDISAEKR